MTLSMLPREGQLIPGLQLPRSDGGSLRLRAYRGRRNLVLLFLHLPGCAPCRSYLSGALDCYGSYAEEDTEVIAIVPGEAEAVAALRCGLALPFPVLVDADGAAFARYGLRAGSEAAVAVADRYGEPCLWQRAGTEHALPAHAALLAEARYLALTCSGGCSTPIW